MAARMLITAVALSLACTAGEARDLTVISRAEMQSEFRRQVYFEPFAAATGITVQEESWEGSIDALRNRLKGPDPGWDLIEVDADELATGCNEGLFEKLDWSAVGGRDHYMSQAVSDCGLG